MGKKIMDFLYRGLLILSILGVGSLGGIASAAPPIPRDPDDVLSWVAIKDPGTPDVTWHVPAEEVSTLGDKTSCSTWAWCPKWPETLSSRAFIKIALTSDMANYVGGMYPAVNDMFSMAVGAYSDLIGGTSVYGGCPGGMVFFGACRATPRETCHMGQSSACPSEMKYPNPHTYDVSDTDPGNGWVWLKFDSFSQSGKGNYAAIVDTWSVGNNMVKAIIYVNSDWGWDNTGHPATAPYPYPHVLEFYEVLVHEFGHVLGFKDYQCANYTKHIMDLPLYDSFRRVGARVLYRQDVWNVTCKYLYSKYGSGPERQCETSDAWGCNYPTPFTDGENYTAKYGGSVYSKPYAYSGKCLGGSWKWAQYDRVPVPCRFPSSCTCQNTRLYIRYGTSYSGGVSVYIDGNCKGNISTPVTGGAEEYWHWQWGYLDVGAYSVGNHTVKFIPYTYAPYLDAFFFTCEYMQNE